MRREPREGLTGDGKMGGGSQAGEMNGVGRTDGQGQDGWVAAEVCLLAAPNLLLAAQGEQWWLAHQRALREACRDDLDGNESAPYGLSVPANPRILQMRGQGKGTRGRRGGSTHLKQSRTRAWSCRRVPGGVQRGSLA